MLALKKGSVLKVRYLVKYTKGSDIKFVGHLDLMRTIQRTFRRALLPAEYSKGFNPHMKLSIAQPLSVGVYSDGEYLDVDFEETVDNDKIISAFNEKSTNNIKLLKVVKIEKEVDKNNKKLPQAMAAVDGAKYVIKIKYENTNLLQEELQELLKSDVWNIVKKSKSGEKEVNIKPMVKTFDFCIENNILIIETIVACGSRENLSADLLAEYIKKNSSNAIETAFTDIKREEIYGILGEKLVPLWEYFKSL